MASVQRLADPQQDGTLFIRDLEAPQQAPSMTDDHVTIREATLSDAPLVQAAMQASGEYPDSVVLQRLEHHRHVYVIENDGQTVSYGWAAFSAEPIGDLGFSFRLGPREVYIYDCATRPQYRGRGYYPLLLQFMCADLSAKGRQRAWIGTAPGNLVSQRGILRAGFTKVADVHTELQSDRSYRISLYGTPGVAVEVLDDAARAFGGEPYPEAGLPADSLSGITHAGRDTAHSEG